MPETFTDMYEAFWHPSDIILLPQSLFSGTSMHLQIAIRAPGHRRQHTVLHESTSYQTPIRKEKIQETPKKKEEEPGVWEKIRKALTKKNHDDESPGYQATRLPELAETAQYNLLSQEHHPTDDQSLMQKYATDGRLIYGELLDPSPLFDAKIQNVLDMGAGKGLLALYWFLWQAPRVSVKCCELHIGRFRQAYELTRLVFEPHGVKVILSPDETCFFVIAPWRQSFVFYHGDGLCFSHLIKEADVILADIMIPPQDCRRFITAVREMKPNARLVTYTPHIYIRHGLRYVLENDKDALTRETSPWLSFDFSWPMIVELPTTWGYHRFYSAYKT